MTTKVEPTVEKWERDFDEKFGDPDAIAAKNAYGDDVYYKYHIEYMPDSLIKDFIRKLLSHSLQEAKAEERRKCLATIMLWRPYFYERKVTKRDKEELKTMFDDLSTLTTKEYN